jgi:hypothetical protein
MLPAATSRLCQRVPADGHSFGGDARIHICRIVQAGAVAWGPWPRAGRQAARQAHGAGRPRRLAAGALGAGGGCHTHVTFVNESPTGDDPGQPLDGLAACADRFAGLFLRACSFKWSFTNPYRPAPCHIHSFLSQPRPGSAAPLPLLATRAAGELDVALHVPLGQQWGRRGARARHRGRRAARRVAACCRGSLRRSPLVSSARQPDSRELCSTQQWQRQRQRDWRRPFPLGVERGGAAPVPAPGGVGWVPGETSVRGATVFILPSRSASHRRELGVQHAATGGISPGPVAGLPAPRCAGAPHPHPLLQGQACRGPQGLTRGPLEASTR